MKEKKDKQILILIEESKRNEFQDACAHFKTTQSKALRKFIDESIYKYRDETYTYTIPEKKTEDEILIVPEDKESNTKEDFIWNKLK